MNLITKLGGTIKLRPWQAIPFFLACQELPREYFAGNTGWMWFWIVIACTTIFELALTSTAIERRYGRHDPKNPE